MANQILEDENYSPRWFIWTIVFLVVTGVSLVSYITISEDSASEIAPLARSSQSLKQVRK